MAPPHQSRVLRCCSCRLFQAHQVKKSLKWTCKACGEKQSFLRAYGEGSGADCRRHVQKLNLLQGQVSELSLRGRSQSTAEPPHSPAAQGPLESQDDSDSGLRGAAQLWSPDHPWRPTAPPSKWARFLLPPAHTPQDTEPPASAQSGPRPASPAQAIPGEGEGCFSRPAAPTLPPRATLTPGPGPERPCGQSPRAEGCQAAPIHGLFSLFSTGEDFEDSL
ncbi:MRN complex-interacting protein [Heterocephalus glaber]|uniref:MRN complex-interacting protein n=1 Tax=Heterocephalus glaber TaxID=10181 RepID=A0AAX6QKC7_HETGA|nr:MRN complex-interacting protein [Heterocephalus glaber]